MFLTQLSSGEQQVVLQCLNTVLKGRELEGEYEARLGISEEELEQVVAAYPNVNDSEDDSLAALAVNNCMNEVCHGFYISDAEWARWFNVSKDEVLKVYQKWARLRGWSHTGVK